MSRSLPALLTLLLVVLSIAGPARGAETLRLGQPSLSMSTVVSHVAKDLGYFEREGVNVEINHFESGSLNIKALLARAVDVSDVETALILGAAAGGADLRIVGAYSNALHFHMYATRDIKTLRDLYGRRFGISGLGGLPHVVIVALLKNESLDPTRLDMVAVGGQGARLRALVAGKIDATVGEVQPEVEADPKLHRLFAVPDKLPLYQPQCIAVYGNTLAQKGPAVAAFHRGLVKTMRFLHSDKDGFLRAAMKHLPGTAKDLGFLYDRYVETRHWTLNGDVDPARIKYMQDLGMETGIQSRAVDLAKLIDLAAMDRALKGLGTLSYPPR